MINNKEDEYDGYIIENGVWYNKDSENDMNRLKLVRDLKNKLENIGIKMSVHACGCCSSPTVRIELPDGFSLNEDEFCFDMFEKGE